MIFDSVYSLVLGDDFPYLVCVVWTSRKFFIGPQSSNVLQKSMIFAIFSIYWKDSWGSMNAWKSLSTDVWGHSFRLGHRMIPPIVFTDRYDPNEVCKHTCWVMVVAKKILVALEGRRWPHQNSLFCSQRQISPSKWVWKPKNHCQLTYEVIAFDRDIVWSHQLFSRIDMIPMKSANTHVGWW